VNKIVLYEIVNQINVGNTELGEKVYEIIKPKIEEYITQGQPFVVDFSQMNAATPAFINKVIGRLFISFEPSDLIKNMSFGGLSNCQLNSLRWSITNALKKAELR
jgi:hypothetical protein